MDQAFDLESVNATALHRLHYWVGGLRQDKVYGQRSIWSFSEWDFGEYSRVLLSQFFPADWVDQATPEEVKVSMPHLLDGFYYGTSSTELRYRY